MDSLHRRRAAPAPIDLGDEDPLYTRSVSRGPPDRRRLSLRWLAGSILTGISSVALVGGTLQGAVGLNDYLIVRPAVARTTELGDTRAQKGDRYRPAPQAEVTRRVIQISTVTREDDRDIVRVRPFAHVRSSLAAPVAAEIAQRIPPFNALDIYSDGKAEPTVVASSDSIYGAEVDGEVAIKVADFPTGGLPYDEEAQLSEAEVAQAVRETAPFLAEGAVEVSSLPYVDPARFDIASSDPTALPSLAVAITPENLSMIAKSESDPGDAQDEDEVVTVSEGDALKKLLIARGATQEAANAIQAAFVANFSFDFRAGQTLRIGLAPEPEGRMRVVRVSLFDGEQHIATVALSDTGTYMAASPPSLGDSPVLQANAAPKRSGALSSVYAGLWGTGLSLEMPGPLIESLVRIFSYDADFQSRLSPSDSIEAIYSAEDGADNSEILYAALSLGGAVHRFYRFRTPDNGSVDYYDEDGKSAKKFLVRKPIVEGRFTSSFGMRYHPILHRYRLHSGIDWGAPSGTPILAAGNGVIEKIGVRSGYGRSITLGHANGYETTYNHMSGYARGLQAGGRVRQGQVIGFVGTSGLSTGPHLHFEVLVNGRFVDPMKIRLPRGRELQGAQLASFEQERQRIDGLLTRDDPRVASSLPN